MSEVIGQTEAANSASSMPGAPNPLRGMREQAGMHQTALAAMLKVPPQKLEALESGRYDDLPNMAFARALATSVCRALKVDPAPVLATLPQVQNVYIRHSDEGLNAPFPSGARSAAGKGLLAVLPMLSRPVFWALVVLLLAAVLWYLLPDKLSELTPVTAPEAEPTALSLETVPEPVPAPAPEVLAAPVAGQQVTSVDVASQAMPQAEAPLPTAALPPAVPAESPAAVVPETAVLKLRVRESSWVQVTGASGRSLLQRTLQAGEEVSFATDLPLAVVLGRADVAEVQVRGAAFDLAPYVRNRVARFEVK
ncbi:MAG TPA: RodZ domain-containing protein [Macromonas sp.]|nr:RodZ domain-containing protein [Macromonas sp.]